MLKLIIPETELFDDRTGEFINIDRTALTLEHSLISISKWESNWEIPFINTRHKTKAQTIDYIKCMTITPNVNPNVYRCITNEHIRVVNEYIDKPMTATTFSDKNKGSRNKKITNEEIYYQMIELGIPVEFEKWHLNRLLTLIHVCTSYRTPGNKRSTSDIIRDHKAINAANRKRFNSKG